MPIENSTGNSGKFPHAIYKRHGIAYKIASSEDDDGLRFILQNTPMDGWIQVTFEREPSFFKSDHLFGETIAVIAHQEKAPQELVGMYTMTNMPVHINGNQEWVGYLGGLRVLKKHRNKIRALIGGFESINQLLNSDFAQSYWFTSLAKDNASARRILEAGIKGLPIYRPVSDMQTLFFPTKIGKNMGLLKPVKKDEVSELVGFYNRQAAQYQFSPALSEAWLMNLSGNTGITIDDFFILKKNNEILGCLAIWDQRKVKQTVVKGYKPPYKSIRILYNIYAKFANKLILPESGEMIEQVYLSFFALDSTIDHLAVDILREALFKSAQKNADIATLGLSTSNPMLKLIKSKFPVQTYHTCIEAVAWQAEDIVSLDSRPAQPEVAFL